MKYLIALPKKLSQTKLRKTRRQGFYHRFVGIIISMESNF